MKAAIIEQYGGWERVRVKSGLDTPVVKPDEVLVKPLATTLNPTDMDVRNGKYRWVPMFWNQENISLTGLEFSGVILKTGTNVKRFAPGDEVFGYIDLLKKHRTHAQYIAVKQNHMALKPINVSHAESASLPVGMITTIRAFKHLARPKDGKNILINGASGGVGVYAVQYAKYLGMNITAVAGKNNFQLLTDLGADVVIDYTQSDFTQGDLLYDMVFDVANTSSFNACEGVLKSKGVYISTDPFKDIPGLIRSTVSSKKAGFLMVLQGNTRDFECAADFVEKGKIRPVVEKIFPFSDIALANRYFESHPRQGKVVLDMEEGQEHYTASLQST